MKRRRKDSIHSYREPSLVPLSEKDKVSRINQAREFGKLALYLWYNWKGKPFWCQEGVPILLTLLE